MSYTAPFFCQWVTPGFGCDARGVRPMLFENGCLISRPLGAVYLALLVVLGRFGSDVAGFRAPVSSGAGPVRFISDGTGWLVRQWWCVCGGVNVGNGVPGRVRVGVVV